MADILILDDEFLLGQDMAATLQSAGHNVLGVAMTAEDAVALAQLTRPQILIANVKINGGGRNGIEAAQEIRSRLDGLIFVTGNTDPGTKAQMEMLSPAAIIAKPAKHREILGVIDQIAGPQR